VAPTEKCNLSCDFCSVKNRNGGYELEFHDLIEMTKRFISLGTRTVEITGGGEPLTYPYLDEYIRYLVCNRIEVGLITNGIGINKHLISVISWIRISANVYDRLGKIDIPKNFYGTLGFSYVWTKESTIKGLNEIRDIAVANKVSYIRLVPDCLGDVQKQNSYLALVAHKVGPPVTLQKKKFRRPQNCYWGYFKPFLYSDGYVYPCSSIVLNPDADRQFHESYRICHASEIESLWKCPIESLVDTSKCIHCVFSIQNRILEYSRCYQRHENFL
jgi:MoaA/NifB/PqqE/SkfB family radical SAM enzyme